MDKRGFERRMKLDMICKFLLNANAHIHPFLVQFCYLEIYMNISSHDLHSRCPIIQLMYLMYIRVQGYLGSNPLQK